MAKMTFGGISKKYESKREKLRVSHISKEQRESEKPTLQESQQKLEKQERGEKIKRLEAIGSRVSKRLFGQKLLKKPTAKVPSVNPQRFISKDSARQSLVREGRTGYFNQEMMEEAKWLS